MRFCLILELEKNVLPVEYRRVIISYIKNAITMCNNGNYYKKFFDNTNQKDYCFSAILPNPKFEKDKIILSRNEIKILFSTNDKYNSGLILFSAFIGQKNKSYPLPHNNKMTLKSIKNEKQEKITNSKVIFKTTIGSGLCVREHDRKNNKDIYYIYDDKEFREKLRLILYNQAIKLGESEKTALDIKVNPIQCKKVVAKHYNRYIDTTVGMFEVEGEPDILQHFYSSGIGSRKSAGFGMVDLVTQDLI